MDRQTIPTGVVVVAQPFSLVVPNWGVARYMEGDVFVVEGGYGRAVLASEDGEATMLSKVSVREDILLQHC